jgi:hypothetical protein
MRSLLICAALIAAPAFAQQTATVGPRFCEDLKAVTAAAAKGFEALKGAKVSEEPRDSRGYATVKYKALRSLDGAAICSVTDYLRPEGKPLRSFVCEWKPVGTKIATTLALGQASETCVGMNDPLDGIRSAQDRDEANADIYGDDFSINIGAGTAPQVFFRVRPE